MKILPFFNNMPFGKTLLNKTCLKTTDGNLKSVNFVEYNPLDDDDIKQFNEISRTWKNTLYTHEIVDAFELSKEKMTSCDKFNSCHDFFYGIEDENGETLGIANIFDWDTIGFKMPSRRIDISYLQTHPNEKFSVNKNPNRRYKGIGETLVAEIVKKAKFDNKAKINVVSSNENFWTKSELFNFTKPDEAAEIAPSRCLQREDFDKFVKYVEDKKI